MRFHVVAVAAMFAILPAFAVAGANADVGPAGCYCGKLRSAGRIVDAETTFQTGTDRRLSGTYQFRDGEGATDGRLREEAKEPGLTRRLRWTDKYGHGRLVITFDPAFVGFDGHWGMLDAVPDQVWTGGRCQEPDS